MLNPMEVAAAYLMVEVYKDAGAPAVAKEIGGLALEGIRTLRPVVELVRTWTERMAIKLGKAEAEIPKERLQEAPAYLSGPLMLGMMFLEDTNPLTDLFFELLKKAMDKQNVGMVHPGFIHVLQQLSPDEAGILHALKQENGALEYVCSGTETFIPEKGITVWNATNPLECDFCSIEDAVYFVSLHQHLASLGLVQEFRLDIYRASEVNEQRIYPLRLTTTDFGDRFLDAVIPGHEITGPIIIDQPSPDKPT